MGLTTSINGEYTTSAAPLYGLSTFSENQVSLSRRTAMSGSDTLSGAGATDEVGFVVVVDVLF